MTDSSKSLVIDRSKYIVVTRQLSQAIGFIQALKSSDFKVFSLPTIETIKHNFTPSEQRILTHISFFDWIIFTSQNSVRFLIAALRDIGMDKSSFSSIKLATVGEKTAEEVAKYDLKVSLISRRLTAEDLVRQMTDLTNTKILLPRSNLARPELITDLQAKGAEVINLPVYQTKLSTKPNDRLIKLLQTNQLACLTFTSPSTVEGFLSVIPEPLKRSVYALPVVCIGPVTAQAARQFGFKSVLTAETHTSDGLLSKLQASAL